MEELHTHTHTHIQCSGDIFITLFCILVLKYTAQIFQGFEKRENSALHVYSCRSSIDQLWEQIQGDAFSSQAKTVRWSL